MYNCTLIFLPLIHLHVCTIIISIHYSVHHEKCKKESEAPAKDLKIIAKKHQESVQESEVANTKVIHCTNLQATFHII